MEQPAKQEGLKEKIVQILDKKYSDFSDTQIERGEEAGHGNASGADGLDSVEKVEAILKENGVDISNLRITVENKPVPYPTFGSNDMGNVYNNAFIKIYEGDKLITDKEYMGSNVGAY